MVSSHEINSHAINFPGDQLNVNSHIYQNREFIMLNYMHKIRWACLLQHSFERACNASLYICEIVVDSKQPLILILSIVTIT